MADCVTDFDDLGHFFLIGHVVVYVIKVVCPCVRICIFLFHIIFLSFIMFMLYNDKSLRDFSENQSVKHDIII